MNPRQRGTDSPTRARCPAVVFLSFLLILPAVAGCLAGPGSQGDASPSEPTGTDSGSAPPADVADRTWNVSITYTPWFLAAYGQPYARTGTVDSCETFVEWWVPRNATNVWAVLEEGPNATGQGYMAHMIQHEKGSWIHPPEARDTPLGGPYYLDLSTRMAIDVEDPRPGNWEAWVFPNQAVVDQMWNLTIHVAGQGGGRADAERLTTESPASGPCE